jgi:hypothetical protein
MTNAGLGFHPDPAPVHVFEKEFGYSTLSGILARSSTAVRLG